MNLGLMRKDEKINFLFPSKIMLDTIFDFRLTASQNQPGPLKRTNFDPLENRATRKFLN
jgi:hypothetical protein